MFTDAMTCRERRIHRAKWVVVDSRTILENGYVITENGRIADAGKGVVRKETDRITDHGPGVLMPGLINAHTHLELSALKGKLSFASGFRDWVGQLLRTRESLGHEALTEGAEQGIAEMKASGCRVAGEISSLGLTPEPMRRAGCGGVWFREFLGEGIEPEMLENLPAACEPADALRFSVAGHAPHTTSPALLKQLKHWADRRGSIFSLHLDESEDEREFLVSGKGEWADFLTLRGIDFSGWGLPMPNPVAYADQLGLLDEKTLCVHLIRAGADAFDLLTERGAKVCICPRSNNNLHGRLPNLEGMLKAGLEPALGTDSLASASSLSLFDEMAQVSRAYPGILPETILSMATDWGAKALGLEGVCGNLIPGRQAMIIYLPVTSASPASLLEQIIHDPLS